MLRFIIQRKVMKLKLQRIEPREVPPSPRGNLVLLSDIIFELDSATRNDDDGLEKARALLEKLREMSDNRATAQNYYV